MKVKYNEQGPVFTGRNEILLEVSNQLLAKAADFLTITKNNESEKTLK